LRNGCQFPPGWVYKQVAAKRIPFLKIGRYVHFEEPALEAWIREQRVDPSQQPSRTRRAT
jgi:hypothetical protein